MDAKDYIEMSTIKIYITCEALTKIAESDVDDETFEIAYSAMKKIDREGRSPWANRLQTARDKRAAT